MGIAVTAGYHVQPENVTYSVGPLKYVPGIDSFIYWLFDIWLYRKIDHVHVPTELGASLLRSHGYKSKLHVISNATNRGSRRSGSARRTSRRRCRSVSSRRDD